MAIHLGRVCVFCGSRQGRLDEYAAAAATLGRAMAHRGIDLVFGGGSVGLMGVMADSVLAAGGKAIGVIPAGLAAREVAHQGVTELHVTTSMHARKAMMADLSDAFVALPGGFGTFEELFEMVTWAQLGIHRKPVGVLNVAGYFDPIASLVAQAIAEDFISPEARVHSFILETDAERLLDRLAAHEPPDSPRWLTVERS